MIIESLENEIWKDVVIDSEVYPYQISSFGRIKSLNYNHTGEERLMKAGKIKGYLHITLRKNGKMRHFFVHRLVATMFIPNLEGKPCVNHKIEGKEGRSMNFVFFKADGSVDEERTTIEWVTYKENSNYGDCILRVKEKLSKQVFQYSENGELLNVYPSIMEVVRQTGYNQGSICDCCNGKQKTHKGYVWSYTELTRKEISNLKNNPKKGNFKKGKKVFQYTISGELVNVYASVAEVEQKTGLYACHIRTCCIGKKETAYGFIWSYEPLPNTTNQLSLFSTIKKIS